jgi:hypothetical protein
VKRKHYDQSYKEAIVAEILGAKGAAQIAQREGIAATHSTSAKRRSPAAIFTIRFALKSSCASAYVSLKVQ